MRARFLYVVAAVAVAGVAGWALFGSGGGPSAPGTEEEGLSGGGAADDAKPAGAKLGKAAPGRAEGSLPPQTGRCSITGTVRRDGKPVAAKVQVSSIPADPSAPEEEIPWTASALKVEDPTPRAPVKAAAGADGKFSVEGLPPGLHWVLAVADDGATGLASATTDVEGMRVQADVVVTVRGERLEGRVVHADGRPWKGRLQVSGAPVDEIRTVLGGAPLETDAEGRFTVTGLAAGSVSIRAVEPDVLAVQWASVRIPHAGEYVLTLDAGAFDVAGRVVAAEGGAAIAGARVTTWGRGGGVDSVAFGAVTDAEGRFVVKAAGSNTDLYASAAGYAEASIDEVSRTAKDLEVKLTRHVRLRGRVTTTEGKPVAAVAVFAEHVATESNSYSFGGSMPTANTDADGLYAFDALVAGNYQVFARGGGWISTALSPSAAGEASLPTVALVVGKEAVADLTVVRGPRIVGVVLDAAGAAVGGARVETVPHGWGAMRFRIIFGASGAGEHAGDVPSVATAADGTFAVDGVLPGVEYDLEAVAAGAAPGKATVAVAGGEAETRVEIRLPQPRFVDVTVVDAATGAPVAGASVAVAAKAERESTVVADGGFTIPDIDWPSFDGRGGDATTTDASGRARAGPVGPGRLEVSASAEGFVSASERQVVEGSDARADGLSATVKLERGFDIVGRVVMPDGTPAAEASVSATPEGARRRSWESETTDGTGAFKIADQRKGRYEVTATLSGEREWTATASTETGQGDLVLHLVERPSRGRIVIRVVDPAGKPIPAASAQITWPGGSTSERVKDGRVAFSDALPAGGDVEAALVVTDAKAEDGTELPFGPTRLEGLRAGQEYVVTMAPEKRIEGRVVGPDGASVAGASVSAGPTQPWERDGASYYSFSSSRDGGVTTDATGAFKIGGLGDGEHTVRVRPPPAFVAPDLVQVQAGATGVVVTLRAGATPTLTVLDWQGKPVSGARATTTKEEPSAERTRFPFLGPAAMRAAPVSGADGRLKLSSLDPAASYVLRVSPPGSRADLSGAVRKRWTAADTTVRLERGYAVQGFVRDPAGRPVEDANVTCKPAGEDAETYSAKAGKDGSFRFTGLRSGPVELTATLSRRAAEDAPRAATTVAPPAEGVILTLDRGLTLSLRVEGWAERGEGWALAVLSEDGADGRRVAAERVAVGGTAKFVGLPAGKTYVIWVKPDEEGRMVFVPGIQAGAGEVVAKLTTGKTITGHVTAPKDGRPEEVSIHERGVRLSADVAEDGSFTLHGVPDGTWKVTANTSTAEGRRRFSGSAEAVAGGTVDIEVKQQK